MQTDERKQFVELLQSTTIFPHYAKQILMAAFFNKMMTDEEAADLLKVLHEESNEMNKINDHLKEVISSIEARKEAGSEGV